MPSLSIWIKFTAPVLEMLRSTALCNGRDNFPKLSTVSDGEGRLTDYVPHFEYKLRALRDLGQEMPAERHQSS